jgi:Polysaccharide biosynthesis/export protein
MNPIAPAEGLGGQVPDVSDRVSSKETDPEPAELTSTGLAIGDKLDIKLFEQLGAKDKPESAGAGALSALIERPELSGTYVVQQDGSITLPLLGTFNLLGASQQQIVESMKRRFSDAFGANVEVSFMVVERETRVRRWRRSATRHLQIRTRNDGATCFGTIWCRY